MLEEKKNFKENKPLMFLVPVFGMMMCIMCVILINQCIASFTHGGTATISYAKTENGSAGGLAGQEENGWSFYGSDDGDGWNIYDSKNSAALSEDGWDYYAPVFSESASTGGEETDTAVPGNDGLGNDEMKATADKDGYVKTDFDPLVKESAAVPDTYFENSLFMGDSRTQGLQYQCGVSGATYMTDVGMNVGEYFDRKSIMVDGKMYTMADAAAMGDYDKIYLMFGINEVGWIYEDIFIEDYKNIIESVKKAHPNAVVYVQSIIHCTEEKGEEDSIFGKKRINYYNRLLYKLAKKENVYYLNINESVIDEETGVLPSGASNDGIHLNKKYCKKWLKYLKTHTVNEDVQ